MNTTNSRLDQTVTVANELQNEGHDPVRAAYTAHLIVSHGADPAGVDDPRGYHQQLDHTGLNHDHTTGGQP